MRSAHGRHVRQRSIEERRARGSALARRCVGSWSWRGDGQRAATKLGVMTSVGARQAANAVHAALDGTIGAPTTGSATRDRETTRLRLCARSSSSCGLSEPARRWVVSSSGAGRDDFGQRSAARPTRRTRRPTKRRARAKGMAGGARGSNDALAAQRSVVVVVWDRGAGAAMGREQQRCWAWRRRSALSGAVKAAHTVPDEATRARQRYGRQRSREERCACGSALARRLRVGSWSRRGDRQRAATKLGVVTLVGARRFG